ARADVDLDGLVELRGLHSLDECDRIRRLVDRLAVHLLVERPVALAVLRHQPTSTPIERAVPAMIFAAWSRSLAFRSCIFVSAIWRTWSWVILATLFRFGSPEPLSIPAASLISTAAGGVFVMNVNERSSKT